MGVKSYLKIKL